jgi:CBS domain-containing protein
MVRMHEGSATATAGQVELPVRCRHLLRGDGAIITSFTVHCPGHDRSVALVECGSCGRASGVHLENGVMTLKCSPVPNTVAPTTHVPASGAARHDCWCATEDAPVARALGIVEERGLSVLTVVDAALHPVGAVHREDLVRVAADGLAPLRTVMRRRAPSMHEFALIARAGALMAWHGTTHVDLLDDHGALVATLDALEVIRAFAAERGYVLPEHAADDDA